MPLPTAILKKNLQKITPEFINDSIRDIVNDNEAEIAALNTEGQLYLGIDSTGKRLTPEYADSTKRRKKAKGQPTDRVTLKDKGFLYEDTYTEAGQNELTIKVHDFQKPLAEKLEEKYGPNIFGLTGHSQAILSQEIILPRLSDKIRKIL